MSEGTHFISENAGHEEANSAMRTNEIKTFSDVEFKHFIDELEHMWKINEHNDQYLSYRIGYDNFFTKNELSEDGLPTSVNIEKIGRAHV
jgi:hypothetical protein